VPPGTTEKIVLPIIKKCFIDRNIQKIKPKIAHSYERVMPGNEYIDSIRKMRRTYSGIDPESAEAAKDFYSLIIDISKYPLWKLANPTSSELGKVLENSYRAVNIAFIHEWTLFAEDIGVDLFEIINSIKIRKGTHDNMMYPGFGVGGYCLTKDPLLAQWSSNELFKRDEVLNFSVSSVDINDQMPLHTFDLIIRNTNQLEKTHVTILGASYRKDVDDTRNSPTIVLYDKLLENGAIVKIHDPLVKSIFDREDILISNNFKEAISGSNVLVFVVNHREYINLDFERFSEMIDNSVLIIDAFNIFSNENRKILRDKGIKTICVGKGD
jgi:nucleotide sugar dehydrogenase